MNKTKQPTSFIDLLFDMLAWLKRQKEILGGLLFCILFALAFYVWLVLAALFYGG